MACWSWSYAAQPAKGQGQTKDNLSWFIYTNLRLVLFMQWKRSSNHESRLDRLNCADKKYLSNTKMESCPLWHQLVGLILNDCQTPFQLNIAHTILLRPYKHSIPYFELMTILDDFLFSQFFLLGKVCYKYNIKVAQILQVITHGSYQCLDYLQKKCHNFRMTYTPES
jgi:hypothetical protein